MPPLVITHDTVTVRLQSQLLELVKHGPSGDANDFVRINVPLHDVDRAFICGRPSVSVAVLQKLMKSGIPVAFLTSHGRWIGALSPEDNPNAERRIRQYEMSKNDPLRLRVAAKIVYAKIRNSRRVLQRLAAARKLSDSTSHLKTAESLKRLARVALQRPGNLDKLRGYEGMAAANYFARLGDYFPDELPFTERSRQPPRDAANSILSWTYAIIQGEIDAAVRAHGLDPYIGFLHTVSHGMPSLVLDLLEPLRAPVGDMLALHLLNHRILRSEHFQFNAEDGGTYLKPESRKEFFLAYEQSMTRLFSLTPDSPHVHFRKIIDSQVLAVIKALEGNGDYEFFLMP